MPDDHASAETVARVRRLWASFAGVDHLEGVQVVVNADSALCPSGWIGVVVIGETITATVPHAELAPPLLGALADVQPATARDGPMLLDRLPPLAEVLGPAALFYATGPPPTSDARHAVEEVGAEELTGLLGSVAEEERDESGVGRLVGRAFVARSSDGSPVAASGYRPWPQQVAHVCVLTHPSYRRGGFGHAVGRAAVQHALAEDRLPQWRARGEPSKALARKLGLLEVGAQWCLRPSEGPCRTSG